MLDPTVPANVASAIDRAEQRVAPPWSAHGAMLTVTFPAANTRRDVAHGLGVIPSGFIVIWANGPIYASPGQLMDNQLAYLQSSVAGTTAKIMFVLMKGDTTNAA